MTTYICVRCGRKFSSEEEWKKYNGDCPYCSKKGRLKELKCERCGSTGSLGNSLWLCREADGGCGTILCLNCLKEKGRWESLLGGLLWFLYEKTWCPYCGTKMTKVAW